MRNVFLWIAAAVLLAALYIAMLGVSRDAQGQVMAEKPFTVKECAAMCEPVPVARYLPGFCHIPDDKQNMLRCKTRHSAAENIVPIYEVCTCGTP